MVTHRLGAFGRPRAETERCICAHVIPRYGAVLRDWLPRSLSSGKASSCPQTQKFLKACLKPVLVHLIG